MLPLPTDDDPLAWLLYRQGGVISARQALHFLTRSALRHRVRSGRWQQVDRRVFVAHTGAVERDHDLWVAVLATGAPLAGSTALGEHGLHRYRGIGIHVLTNARKRILDPPPGVFVHRTRVLSRSDLQLTADPPRTSAARTVVDAAQWATSDDDACALIAAAFQRRLVVASEIEATLNRLTRARRRALIRATAADAAGGAHSLAELDYLRLNRRYGLPEPSLQVRRSDARGRTRYLDVYYGDFGVHVEIDGGQHTERRATWADMKRQNDVWIKGDRVLRFPAWLVRQRPDEVIGQVSAALAAAGWGPTAVDRGSRVSL